MQSRVYSYCKLLAYVFRIYIWSSNLFRIFLLHQVSINSHEPSSFLHERWIRFPQRYIHILLLLSPLICETNLFLVTCKRILNEIIISLRKIYELHFVVGKIMYLSAMSSAEFKYKIKFTHNMLDCKLYYIFILILNKGERSIYYSFNYFRAINSNALKSRKLIRSCKLIFKKIFSCKLLIK